MAGAKRSKDQKHLHGKARDARALEIAKLWLNQGLTQEQIGKQFQLSTNQVARDIRRVERMGLLDDHHHRVINSLVTPAIDTYERGLTAPDDPDRQERMARDVMFGVGLLQKNPQPIMAQSDAEQMTLEKWRVTWKKRQEQPGHEMPPPAIDAEKLGE